jgi:hypothetical protein
MLVLPIKKKWFEMIVSGEKTEEYREFKEYYHIRFKRLFGLDYKNKSAEIVFRNGYNYKSPSVRCLCALEVGTGKKEWGANPNEKCYKLIILRVLEVRNYNV